MTERHFGTPVPSTSIIQQLDTTANLAVRIMTWNIHGGVGSDRRMDLERVIQLIKRHSPDIVAIQEIGSRRRTGAPEGPAFERLVAALGPHAAEARVITAPDGDYGHALIGRWPLIDVVYHDISLARREPRVAIETTATTPAGPLHLVAAHLGLSFHERRHQARLLRSVAESGAARSVVLGDFNDWLSRGSVQAALAEAMPVRTRHKTFPAWFPVFALDRIYCRPGAMLVRSCTDPLARFASDHLPVIADLDLTATPPPPCRAPSAPDRE